MLLQKKFKKSADVYSFGVILYMLLRTRANPVVLTDNNMAYEYKISDFDSPHR